MTTPFVRRGSFQARLSLLVAAAVGVAVTLVAISSFAAVDHELHNQVRANVTSVAGKLEAAQGGGLEYVKTPGVVVSVYQANSQAVRHVTLPNGTVLPLAFDQLPLPTRAQLALLHPGAHLSEQLTTGTLAGTRYLMAAVPLNGYSVTSTGSNGAPVTTAEPLLAVVGAPLTGVDNTLDTLKFALLLVVAGGILLALAIGWAVGRTTLRPVRRLTVAAEHVAETQELDAVIPLGSDDELGRLAHAFNDMLAALGASRRQQAQLVSDAGHELRTPLTSLRTNVELLVRAKNLPEADRAELIADVTAQMEELTTLIGDLVELARHEERQPEPTEIRLDILVERAVDRARRRAPGLTFDVRLTPGSVRAQPGLLERAVLNVLDNAAKFSPPGSTVTVTLARSSRWILDVVDHGPGIATEDRTRVFDRFYRAPAARAMPGSGLGLAIVSQVVRAHGGTVTVISPLWGHGHEGGASVRQGAVDNEVGGSDGSAGGEAGGTLMRIELPIVVEQEPVMNGAGPAVLLDGSGRRPPSVGAPRT